MAGYAVECLLKAKIMGMFSCQNLEELEERLHRTGRLAMHRTMFTHQLTALIRLTGRFDVMRQNMAVWQAFLLVNTWLPAWRYEPYLANQDESRDFLDAVDAIITWIRNNT